MSGHRKARGRPARSGERAHLMAERLAAAPTPEARLAAAFDWFRSAVARDRKRRDSDERAAALMREATDWLAHMAARIEGGSTA